MQKITIGENEAGQRFDKMLAKYLNKAPKSFLYKMLRKKNIILNGRKASGSEKLQTGDEVKLFLSDETIAGFSQNHFQCTDQKLDILYEDENIALINKPAGMLSQKASPEDVSLVEHFITYLVQSGQLTKEAMRTFHPSVCNRLDRNTSGIVAAGKSMAGLQDLSRLFKDRTIGKYYLCLVDGRVEYSSHIRGYLKKNNRTNQVEISEKEKPGSSAIETEFSPFKTGADTTLLEVHLITGKTHQIRAHLASVGHPILGDQKYGDSKLNDTCCRKYNLNHQLLHAYKITFPQLDGALSNLSGQEFFADLPLHFQRIAKDKGVF